MVRRLLSALLCFPALTLFAQQGGEKLARETGQLAIVTIVPAHIELKLGQDLDVKLTVKAGNRGAFIPNHFGDWYDTCQTGFAVNIYTLEGDFASATPKGCAGSWLSNSAPARELLKDYVLLKPGESRSWRTTLTQIRKSKGIYEIKAEYYSRRERVEEVAILPEVHGLMVVGHVTAKPVRIRIR